MTRHLLIVDDNDKYAKLIHEHFTSEGYTCQRVENAAAGIEAVKQHGLDYFTVVVTDITMESQTAGFKLIKYLRKNHFPGTLVVASTGFDVYPGMVLAKMLMGDMGVDFLIPKTTVIKQDFHFYEPRLYARPTPFREKGKARHGGTSHGAHH